MKEGKERKTMNELPQQTPGAAGDSLPVGDIFDLRVQDISEYAHMGEDYVCLSDDEEFEPEVLSLIEDVTEGIEDPLPSWGFNRLERAS